MLSVSLALIKAMYVCYSGTSLSNRIHSLLSLPAQIFRINFDNTIIIEHLGPTSLSTLMGDQWHSQKVFLRASIVSK